MGNSRVTLSEKQEEIVKAIGNVVVNACPGSGKTFSVAARIAHLLATKEYHHQGIAAISFTNTAWEEIEKKLKEDFYVDIPMRYPHFLGTINSFINEYVTLPFGHLLLKLNKKVELVGEPHTPWSGKGYYSSFFDKISYNINNEPFIFSGTIIRRAIQNDVFKTKGQIIKKGILNQSDSDYLAMKTLQNYPLITRNIATRFPYLVIDEAQDTTDVQMEIINLLSQYTKEIMLIGDPDQAIFEWNHAKPSLFTDKIDEWKSEIKLDENRRSSLNICNCANAFLKITKSTPYEKSKVKDYPFIPVLKEYNSDDQHSINQIKNDFLDLCKEHEIEENRIAIIYRSKSFGRHLGVPIIQPNKQPWQIGKFYVRDIVHGKYLYENGDLKKGFKYMELGFHKANTGNSYLENNHIRTQVAEKGFVNYRKEIIDFIYLLPDCKGENLNDWLVKASNKLNGKYAFDFTIDGKLGDRPIESYFGDGDLTKEENKYHVGTIHSVKGETYDAILLFLNNASGCRTLYSNIFKKTDDERKDEEREEMRIVYVGLTRARKILVIAVPNGNKNIWCEKLKLE